jgi:hypothetical protein
MLSQYDPMDTEADTIRSGGVGGDRKWMSSVV